MSADARIMATLPLHPKTRKLIKRHGQAAAWNLVCLFLFACENKPKGVLDGMTAEDIELACDWQGDDGLFVSSLVEVGFLDLDGDTYAIHDWATHNPWANGKEERSEAARKSATARWAKRYSANADASNPQCGSHDSALHPAQNGNAPFLSSPTPILSLPKEHDAPDGDPPKKPKSRKTPIPENFSISDRVSAWATAKGHNRLEERLEHFVSRCKMAGYQYVDWDEAFMTAIRDDWAKLPAPTADYRRPKL